MHTNTTNKTDQSAEILKYSLFHTLQQFVIVTILVRSVIALLDTKGYLFRKSCADDSLRQGCLFKERGLHLALRLCRLTRLCVLPLGPLLFPLLGLDGLLSSTPGT